TQPFGLQQRPPYCTAHHTNPPCEWMKAPTADRNTPMKARNQQRLIFFGDSICVGQGVSIHKGWVARLAAHISDIAEARGRDIVVINASINGNTTRQALERMPYDVQSHGVDYMIVQFGLNDCNYWESDRGIPRVSPKAFAANLDEIIARASIFGAIRIVVHTNHPTTRTENPFPHTTVTYEQSNRRYNE